MSVVRPSLPEPFEWDEHGAIALAMPGGEVRFTTCAGPDLRDWRSPDVSAAVAAIAGVPASRVAWAEQVHGARVAVADPAGMHDAAPTPADGQVTGAPGVACAIRVADCLPVALTAPQAVGVLHAGWRGLAAGIIGSGVAALRGLGAGEIRAAIGPGARVCCYQAGEEVHAALAAAGPSARDGDRADLPAVARAMLKDAGVAVVHDSAVCTICAPDGLFWSHRRLGEQAGRQGAIAWRS